MGHAGLDARRDEAQCEARALRAEAEKMRAKCERFDEVSRLHASLQRDYASLRKSFEASERIRLKQKSLIQLHQEQLAAGGGGPAAALRNGGGAELVALPPPPPSNQSASPASAEQSSSSPARSGAPCCASSWLMCAFTASGCAVDSGRRQTSTMAEEDMVGRAELAVVGRRRGAKRPSETASQLWRSFTSFTAGGKLVLAPPDV